MRSCLSAIIPSLAAALLLTAPAFAAPAPTSKRSGCPRPNRRHVFLQRQRQDADLSRIRLPLLQLQGLHGAFQIRGRGPQQRIQTLQTLFGPRGQIGFGRFAGVLGRSPDKGRPRFSSSPNLPARPLPAKPFMRIALFAAFSGAACRWIRHFKADPKRPPLAVPLSG